MTGNHKSKRVENTIFCKMKQYITVLSILMDCSYWLLFIATADTVVKDAGPCSLILITKNTKVFHDTFKQLLQQENKEQTVKLADAEDMR